MCYYFIPVSVHTVSIILDNISGGALSQYSHLGIYFMQMTVVNLVNTLQS